MFINVIIIYLFTYVNKVKKTAFSFYDRREAKRRSYRLSQNFILFFFHMSKFLSRSPGLLKDQGARNLVGM